MSRLPSLLLITALFSLFSCKNDPAASTASEGPKVDTVRVEPASLEGAATYRILEGSVYWAAKKALGEPHNGTVEVRGGSFQANNGQLIRGNAVLDMSTIAVVNMKDGGEKAELEAHLKSADFFASKDYPVATFAFDEALPSNNPAFNAVLAGQLTLKDKTNPVNIPVKITQSGDAFAIESAAFTINRTQWGVNFRSGLLGTAKDKLIEDPIMLTLRIKALKE